jgi:hypothetical protein
MDPRVVIKALLFSVVFFFFAMLLIGFLWGYECGVKDTEERWTEAVGRARAKV